MKKENRYNDIKIVVTVESKKHGIIDTYYGTAVDENKEVWVNGCVGNFSIDNYLPLSGGHKQLKK